MASTYTTGFGIEKIGSGEQSGTWGTTTNHNLDIIDRIASYKAVAITTNARYGYFNCPRSLARFRD